MLANVHKYFWLCYLLLPVLLGAALGHLAAVGSDIWLSKPLPAAWQSDTAPPQADQPPGERLPADSATQHFRLPWSLAVLCR
ncbi:MAG: hypothetical protein R2864_13015 [Syntrophotaleaceae bacterium]